MITTAADIVRILFDDLTLWTGQNQGTVAVAKDPFDLMDRLGRRPTSFGLTLYWEGDEPADSRVRDVRVVNNKIRVVVDGELNATAIANAELFRELRGRPPMLTLISAVRARIMSYRFPWLGTPNDRMWYQGADDKVPMPDGNYILAFNLMFKLCSEIEVPTEVVELKP